MRSEGASYKFDGGYKPITTFARLEQSRLTTDFTKDILRKRALGEENPIVQPELTDQSASVITRIARAVNNSKIKAVGLLFPIIAGLPACADNTVDSTTTTPPITTVSTTTTTEAPTTTTTTIPETTTTTEAIDVSRTVEENRFYGSPVFFLGSLGKNELNSDMWFNDVTVRGYNLKTITNYDYQGRQVDEIIMEVVVGKNKDGSARTQNYFVAAPSEMKSIGILRSNTINNDNNTYDFVTIKTNPELFMKLIEEYVGSNREFFMIVPYKIDLVEDCSTHDAKCDYVNELKEYVLINEKYVEDLDLLFEALLSSDPSLYNGLNNYSGSEFGFPTGIRLPPPSEGWEVWDANH